MISGNWNQSITPDLTFFFIHGGICYAQANMSVNLICWDKYVYMYWLPMCIIAVYYERLAEPQASTHVIWVQKGSGSYWV